jgi:hypothetical protein
MNQEIRALALSVEEVISLSNLESQMNDAKSGILKFWNLEFGIRNLGILKPADSKW